MDKPLKFLFKGEQFDLKGLQARGVLSGANHSIVAVGDQFGDGKTAYVFDEDTTFRQWAAASPLADKFKELDALVLATQKLEGQDHARTMASQQKLVKRVKEDIEELAERFGLDVYSEELIKLAKQGVSVLEGPVLRSAILYDGSTCSGGWLPLFSGVPYPVLSWVGFNDKASSYRVTVGLGVLRTGNWFTGSSAYIGGIGAVCIDLSNIGFNNIASSAAML